MAFDLKYYQDKKQTLMVKAQRLQQTELNKIAEYEKENVKVKEVPTPK
jgi:hypothetical protein